MLSQSVVEAPFVSILQTMQTMQKAHKRFREKRGNFREFVQRHFKSAQSSKALTRVKIRSLESIKGQAFKIELLLETLSVIMRRQGKMDHHLV